MAHICLSGGPFRSRGQDRDFLWPLMGTDDKWKQDFAAEQLDGYRSPRSLGIVRSRWLMTFRVKPPRISGQLKGSSVLWHMIRHVGKSASSLSEMRFYDSSAGGPEGKQMALKAKSGWHQLLKVTLKSMASPLNYIFTDMHLCNLMWLF